MKYLVTGGCGFIGSHVVRRLLADDDTEAVCVVDNFVSGTVEHLGALVDDPRLVVIEADLKDADVLVAAADGVGHIFHFAANPDIAKAMVDPAVDFWEGTLLTQNIAEAARLAAVKRISYASGSGVYGDRSHDMPDEAFGPLEPVSPYGASKLGCEAILCAYSHMFGMTVRAFRFANVVGDMQTHGVTYDFVRKLREDPSRLEILGDGSQEKSYIHIDDVVEAMFTAWPSGDAGFAAYNVGTGDTITVRRIAELVVEQMGLPEPELAFGTEPRGWRGDVPVVRFDDSRLRSLGWSNARSSEEAIIEAIRASMAEVAAD